MEACLTSVLKTETPESSPYLSQAFSLPFRGQGHQTAGQSRLSALPRLFRLSQGLTLI